MFWKKDKAAEAIKKAVKDLAGLHSNSTGTTRRATNMIPLAAAPATREVAHTGSLRFHQLLISLEGNQRTGCLRIVSPKRKSRSAIMIYKGRVVGCLFGCKKLDFQSLMQDAHKEALADLAAPGNILDAYELPEELVLAAASLFNGEVLDTNFGTDPASCFEQAFRSLAGTQKPGCLVISTPDDEMLCMVYVSDGKIIGVFTPKDGWVSPSFESATRYLKSGQSLRISASILTIDKKQAASIGFSLTGLADVASRRWEQQQIQAIDSFSTIRTETSTYSKVEPILNRQLPAPIPTKPRSSSPVRSTNVFAIAPFA